MAYPYNNFIRIYSFYTELAISQIDREHYKLFKRTNCPSLTYPTHLLTVDT